MQIIREMETIKTLRNKQYQIASVFIALNTYLHNL